MRAIIPLALAAMIAMFAPVGAEAADEECPEGYTSSPEGCSKQAWVDDCPPDHMCAASSDPKGPDGNASGDEPTYGPCGGEVCAYDNTSQPYGPEDCIHCSSPPPMGNGTCMDGAEAGEACDDDVQYLGPEPSRGPSDGSCPHCRGDGDDADPVMAPGEGAPASADGKDAPFAAAILLLVGLLALGAAARRS